MPSPLFEVRGLGVAVFDERAVAGAVGDGVWSEHDQRHLGPGWVRVIEDMSLSVEAGEVLAIVGESGSGKTLTVLGSFDLLGPGARILAGSVRFDGAKIYPLPRVRRRLARIRRKTRRTKPDDRRWRATVGKQVGFLFQDAVGSWTPHPLIGVQAGEALGQHSDLSDAEIQRRVLEAFGEVKLPRAWRYASYAHELSRGEAQRAMLAAALVKSPRLLIADEPLSGLDASVARAVLDLISDLRQQHGMAMVLVTHDLATVASIADRVAVMYGGRIIEVASTSDIFHRPRHPYTDGLLGSIPWPGVDRLRPIEGDPPRLIDVRHDSCTFAPRCRYRIDACLAADPELAGTEARAVACFREADLTLPGVS